MRKKLLILNGPNLNLLGVREPNIYGSDNFETFFETLSRQYPAVELQYYQTNVEGELINKLHEVGFTYDGIIINAGGYTHTSVALRDAIAAITTPVIEVHISNTAAREEFRHYSYLSCVCMGVIIGFGFQSYKLAMEAFMENEK